MLNLIHVPQKVETELMEVSNPVRRYGPTWIAQTWFAYSELEPEDFFSSNHKMFPDGVPQTREDLADYLEVPLADLIGWQMDPVFLGGVRMIQERSIYGVYAKRRRAVAETLSQKAEEGDLGAIREFNKEVERLSATPADREEINRVTQVSVQIGTSDTTQQVLAVAQHVETLLKRTQVARSRYDRLLKEAGYKKDTTGGKGEARGILADELDLLATGD